MTTTGVMEGALWGTDVVLFSTQPFRAPPALPFSHTLPGMENRTHTLVNVEGGYEIAVIRGGSQPNVTVSRGTAYTASPRGIIRIVL